MLCRRLALSINGKDLRLVIPENTLKSNAAISELGIVR